jgi:hypothetical protein
MPACPTNLWRAVHKDDFPEGPIVNEKAVTGALYPTFEKKFIGSDTVGNAKYRDPDVTVTDGMVQPGGGTSLYNKSNFFKGKNWNYMLIPAGTDVDPNLAIVGPDPRPAIGADHYQIEAAKPLFIDQFKGALDNLARAAVAKAYENAHNR